MDKQLLKKIKDYSAVAGAVLATGISADAQIVYTDIEPDITITSGQSYELDLNNNGLTDFVILGYSNGIKIDFSSINQVLGNTLNTYYSGDFYYTPFALDKNAEIGSEQTNWNMNDRSNILANTGIYGNIGNWVAGQSNKYLGLRIKFEQNTLYGWLRLDVAPQGENCTIKDYAYEQTAGKSIKADDDGTVTVNELNKKSAFTVYPNPAKNIINIETELNDFDLEIIDITGRTILKAKNERMLNLSNFQKGTYIVRITSKKGEISNQRIILK